MVLVEPAKVVLVRRDGQWYDGELRAWRKSANGWLANVRYSVAPGMRYLEWVDAEGVRQA
jgi:hypothetical protein